jgi:hypothetical protein
MKKIFRFSLAALLLVALLLSAVSCEFGMENITGYTLLRDHIIDEVGYDQNLNLNDYATVCVATLDGGDFEIRAAIGAMFDLNGDGAGDLPVRIFLTMDGSVEKAHLRCEVLDPTTAAIISSGDTDILLTHYTGNESITFETVNNISISGENTSVIATGNYGIQTNGGDIDIDGGVEWRQCTSGTIAATKSIHRFVELSNLANVVFHRKLHTSAIGGFDVEDRVACVVVVNHRIR